MSEIGDYPTWHRTNIDLQNQCPHEETIKIIGDIIGDHETRDMCLRCGKMFYPLKEGELK